MKPGRKPRSADMVPAGEQAPKKKDGRHGQNSPWVQRAAFGTNPDDRVLISKLMGETLESWRKPRVKSDEELIERLNEFFRECAEEGKIPTMEEIALCTGYTYFGMYDIMAGRNAGFSPETKNIFKRAKEFMKTFDAKLVMTGEINPVLYFFRAKNFYDMKDQQEVTLTANTADDQQMSKEDLEKWYLEDGKKVTTDFADEKK